MGENGRRAREREHFRKIKWMAASNDAESLSTKKSSLYLVTRYLLVTLGKLF